MKVDMNISTDVSHKMVRKQQATKERNFERKRFQKILVNLEGKLKESQLSLVRSRNLQLPKLNSLDDRINQKMDRNKFDYLFGKRKGRIMRRKYKGGKKGKLSKKLYISKTNLTKG